MWPQIATRKQLIVAGRGDHGVDQSQQLVFKIVNRHLTQPHFPGLPAKNSGSGTAIRLIAALWRQASRILDVLFRVGHRVDDLILYPVVMRR
jgi:hypothetical protein